MEFTLYGFDVYSAEVDDKGIDCVIRHNEARYYDIQVKSVRGLNYIFMQKDKFRLRSNLLVAVAIFFDGQFPHLFLIPASVWLEPNPLLVSRDYEGKKSKPDWGINLSQLNFGLLQPFAFQLVIATL